MFDFGKLSLRSFDWKLLVSVILLVAVGLTAIYSVDLSRKSELFYFKKQLFAFGIGLVLLFFISISQHTLWQFLAKWWYLVAFLFLIGVLIFGTNIRGTRGWFTLPGFSFQPVETAKIGLILMLAYIISRFGRRYDRPLFFFGTGIVAFLYIGLVMLQPDLGSAFLLGIIWFGLMMLVGARRLFLLILTGGVILAGVSGWFFFFKDEQKERLATFINPEKDPLGAGYNITQSIIAIGAGRLYGRGLGFGSQSQLRFLPEARTDFVFSVIGEELGFAGVAVVLALFIVMFWRLVVFIKNSNNDFASVAASGILIMFFAQFFTNVGANIGLLPITGVTLPFVSSGGSSLIVNLVLIGLVESMMVRRY